jgi:hypothetical protein
MTQRAVFRKFHLDLRQRERPGPTDPTEVGGWDDERLISRDSGRRFKISSNRTQPSPGGSGYRNAAVKRCPSGIHWSVCAVVSGPDETRFCIFQNVAVRIGRVCNTCDGTLLSTGLTLLFLRCSYKFAGRTANKEVQPFGRITRTEAALFGSAESFQLSRAGHQTPTSTNKLNMPLFELTTSSMPSFIE